MMDGWKQKSFHCNTKKGVQTLKNNNFCILTGFVINNSKNANNLDIKRPIIEVEFVSKNEQGEVSFEHIFLLFSDITLAKISSGYQIGDMLLITGRLLNSKRFGFCIDVISCSELPDKPEKPQTKAYYRAKLLQLAQCFNMVEIKGIVKDDNIITISRQNFSRGDLTTKDDIPIRLIHHKALIKGETAICSGFLGSMNHKELCLIVNSACMIKDIGE